MVRREGFEPPAFWPVGCLKGKSELFRLRFVLFAAVLSADFPLFPPRPARSNSVLGQNWVKRIHCFKKSLYSMTCILHIRVGKVLVYAGISGVVTDLENIL